MSSEKIRNLVFLGASSAGKTSLIEALAHHLGKVDRLGSVNDGTTLCDFHEEEREKQTKKKEVRNKVRKKDNVI